jgi:peptide/nickel transport system substrate-binding protein
MKPKNRLSIVLLLILFMLLAACGGGTQEPATTEEEPATTEEEPATTEEEPATTEEEPATTEEETVTEEAEEAAPTEAPAEEEAAAEETEGERKIASFIFTQEFDTLSPLYTGMWFSGITAQIWNAWAWNFDSEGNPVPVLVTEIPSVENGGISEDGRTLTFKLRDDITWSDGTPITADDFVFTYEMIVDPNNIVSSTYPYDQIESMEAADEHTVVVTFAEPFAPWLATLWHGILPAHVLRPVYEADGTLDNADWNLAPTVGAGPYVFAEWESGSYARFVRNENYYGTPPNIDELFIRFVPDDASQTAALVAGEADLGTFIAYSDVPTLQDAGLEIITQPSGYNEGWFFYLDPENGHPALQDVRVRQAIAMAFDRATLNQDLLLGLTQPAATLWDNTPYVDPTIEPWPYDPEQANALLDEAGWVDSNGDGTRDKDGVELVLVHGTTIREIRQDAQAVAQQQLAEVGIGLDIQSFDASVLFGSYGDGGPAATGELDIFEWSDAPDFPDPNKAYWLCSEIPTDEYPDGSNWQKLCDEELDSLFQLQATQTNFEERQQTFYEITRFMFDNVIWLGLWEDPDVWAISDRLENVTFSGATPFYSIAEWDLSQ